MKHLMMTTALATLLAFPLAAQESGQAGTQTEQAQSGQSSATALRAGQIEIQASSLIGQRLYIQRERGSTMEGLTAEQAPGTAPAEGAQTEQAQGEQPVTEGQQTEQAQGEQPVTEGQQTEQAQGEQPVTEGQQTEQAQGEQPVTEGQATEQAQAPAPSESGEQMDLAAMQEGISEVPDNWTMAGEVDDVLLSAEGQVQALVVDAGGFLGMGDATRRIDIQDVAFVPDLDNEGEFYAVYTGDRATLEQSEPFNQDEIAEGTMRGSETWGDEIRGEQSDVAFTSLTSEDLVGTAVYGADDNWVGEISELALTESGEVEAVVIDVGGFLGIGEKPVALSMDQIQLRRGEGGMFRDDLRAYVNASEEELESLPAWEDDAG
jgi:hypothetical protein